MPLSTVDSVECDCARCINTPPPVKKTTSRDATSIVFGMVSARNPGPSGFNSQGGCIERPSVTGDNRHHPYAATSYNSPELADDNVLIGTSARTALMKMSRLVLHFSLGPHFCILVYSVDDLPRLFDPVPSSRNACQEPRVRTPIPDIYLQLHPLTIFPPLLICPRLPQHT